MAEYINKKAAVGILEAMSKNTDCGAIEKRLKAAAKRIGGLYTPEVAPVVHGKWLDAGRGIKACSNCNHGIKEHMACVNHYCPNCGAKMDGGVSE